MKLTWCVVGASVGMTVGLLVLPASCQEPIKVGWLGPLTGPVTVSALGLESKRGVEVAAEELNAVGGIHGRKIEVVFADSEFKPDVVPVRAKELVEQQKVVAILGEINTALTLRALKVTESAKLPLISYGGLDRGLTRTGVEYVFRVPPSLTVQFRTAMAFSLKRGRGKRPAILYHEDYGDLAQDLGKFARVYDVAVHVSEKFARGTSDFSAPLTKMKHARSDLLFVIGNVTEFRTAIKDAAKLGIDASFVGCECLIDLDALLSVIGVSRGRLLLESDYVRGVKVSATSSRFEELFQKRYGKPASRIAALSYDGLYLLGEALKIGGPTSDGARKGLLSLKDVAAVAGKYVSAGRGEFKRQLFMREYKEGKTEVYQIDPCPDPNGEAKDDCG